MNFRNALSLLTIFILAIAFASSASGTEWVSTGQNHENLIDLEGIEFNVPDGYEDAGSSVVNETHHAGLLTYVLNQKTLVDSDGDEIMISVIDFNGDVDYELMNTFMDLNGNFMGNDGSASRTYSYGDRLVNIVAPDEGLIDQVIPIEDA